MSNLIKDYIKIENERDSFYQTILHSEEFFKKYIKRNEKAIGILKEKGVYGINEAIEILEGKYTLNEFDFDVLVDLVEEWGLEKGILDKSTPKDQVLKIVEEVGELCADVAKGRDPRDSIGDILVTLILFCRLEKINILECLNLAYEEIKGRKGQMINGIFVKQ